MPWAKIVAARKKYWPHAALLLIGIGIFFDTLVGLKHLAPENTLDFYKQWAPYWVFMRTEYRLLNFPLWCHNLLAGFPLAHFPHAAVFYPLNAVLFLFDFEAGLTWYYLLHLWLLGMFTYACAREMGASRMAAFLAGAGLPLSGFIIGRWTASNDNNAVVWVAAGLWFSLRYLNRDRLLDLLGLAAATGLAVLAGNFEVIFFSYATFIVFLVLTRRPRARVGVGVLAALVLGLFFGTPQFLTTTGFLSQSYRHFHAIPYTVNGGDINPFLAINFMVFWPSLPARETLALYYLGFVPLLGLFFMPPGRERRVLAVAAVILVLITINAPPMNYLFQAFPVLGEFSAPNVRYRAIYGLLVLVFIGSARGLDVFLQPDSPFPARKFLAFVATFLLLHAAWVAVGVAVAGWSFPLLASRLVFLAALVLVSGLVLRQPFAGRRKALLVVILLLDLGTFGFQSVTRSKTTTLDEPDFAAVAGKKADLDRVHMVSPIFQDQNLWQMVRLDRGPGYITGFIRNGINRYNEIIFRLRPSLDLFSPEIIAPQNRRLFDFLGVKYLLVRGVTVPGTNPLSLLNRDLQSNYSGPGAALTRPLISQETVSLTAGWTWRLKLNLFPGDELCFEAPDSRTPALEIYLAAGNTVVPAAGLRSEKTGFCAALPVAAPGERMLEIRIPENAGEQKMVRPRIIGLGRPFQLAGGDERFAVYENGRALARYGLYFQYRVLPGDQTLEALFDASRFDPAAALLVTREDLGSLTLPASRQLRLDAVSTVEYRQSEVALESDSPAPALLSAAEVYFPGWRAWVDGREFRIIRVNHAFSAVPVPAGRHRVVLRFEPREFRIGLWLMLASLLSAAVAVAVYNSNAVPHAAGRRPGERELRVHGLHG